MTSPLFPAGAVTIRLDHRHALRVVRCVHRGGAHATKLASWRRRSTSRRAQPSVTFDPSGVSVNELCAAVASAGYGASLVDGKRVAKGGACPAVGPTGIVSQLGVDVVR